MDCLILELGLTFKLCFMYKDSDLVPDTDASDGGSATDVETVPVRTGPKKTGTKKQSRKRLRLDVTAATSLPKMPVLPLPTSTQMSVSYILIFFCNLQWLTWRLKKLTKSFVHHRQTVMAYNTFENSPSNPRKFAKYSSNIPPYSLCS